MREIVSDLFRVGRSAFVIFGAATDGCARFFV